MKKFYWSLAVFALLFLSAVSTAYARDIFIAKQGENSVVFESLEDNTTLYKLLSPQGKVLWKYHLEDKETLYAPKFVGGRIYQLSIARQFVLNLYTIDLDGTKTSKEISGIGTQLTKAGIFYTNNEENRVYFAPYKDIENPIAYSIPNTNHIRRAYSTGEYHVLVSGNKKAEETLYILQGEKLIAQKTMPKYSYVNGAEQIGNLLFFYVQGEKNYEYLHAYNLQKKTFWAKQVKPNKGSLYVAFISPKGDGYVLYGGYTEGVFAMELDAQLKLKKSVLYKVPDELGLINIEGVPMVWDYEKGTGKPLEDFPVQKFKMWLSYFSSPNFSSYSVKVNFPNLPVGLKLISFFFNVFA